MTGPGASKLIYVAIMGFTIAALALSAVRKLIDLAELRSGARSKGRIVSVEVDDDDTRFQFLTYSFLDRSRRRHHNRIYLKRSDSLTLQAGSEVDVVYQATKPGNSYLADSDLVSSHRLGIYQQLAVAAALSLVALAFVKHCMIADSCLAGD